MPMILFYKQVTMIIRSTFLVIVLTLLKYLLVYFLILKTWIVLPYVAITVSFRG
jgi:hypothetical protein